MKLILLLILGLAVVNADKPLREAFEPFSNLANQFLSTVQPNANLEWLFDNFLKPMLAGGSGPDISSQISTIITKYLGYIILVGIGVLFAIFFTLIGCICCCCATCCKSKKRTPEVSNMACKRTVYHVFIIIFTLTMALGAIVGIVSTQILSDALAPKDSTKDSERNIITNLDKTFTYANSYIKTLSTAITTKIGPELVKAGSNIVQGFIGIAKALLDAVLNPIITSLTTMNTELTKMVVGMDSLKTNALNLSTVAQKHLNESNILDVVVNQTKASINSLLGSCSTTECQNVRSNISYVMGYQISNINYTADVVLGQALNAFDDSALKTAPDAIGNTSATLKNESSKAIAVMESTFAKVINDSGITNLIPAGGGLGGIETMLNDYKTLVISNYDSMLVTNKSMVNYGFMGLAILIGIVLFICLFFIIGVGFGICGGPVMEDASKCNKGVGRSCYIASFSFAVIFSWILMLISMITFLLGGVLQTEMCRYISPLSSKSYHEVVDKMANTFLVDQKINLGNASISLPQLTVYSGIMNDCPKGTSLLKSVGITDSFTDSVFTIVNDAFIKPQYVTIDKQLDGIDIPSPDVSELQNTLKDIETFLNALVDPNENKTLTELEKNLLNTFDRAAFISAMDAQATATSNAAYTTEKNNLINQLDIVEPVRIDYLKYKKKVIEVRKALKASLSIIQDVVTNLNSSIATNKDRAISDAKSNYPAVFSSSLKTALTAILNSLGDCKDLYLALESGTGAVCRDFLYPFNNIWLGIGFYLLFIIVTLALAFSAGRLYIIPPHLAGNVQYNNAYQGSSEFKKAIR